MISLYSFSEADEECSNTNFEVSPPDYAETEEEKVLRLELELMLALEQFDSCLEQMENSVSSSSSSSDTARPLQGAGPKRHIAGPLRRPATRVTSC